MHNFDRETSLSILADEFGERAFFMQVLPPATHCLSLPDNIRTVADLARFRKPLKSHYFRVACNFC